MMTTAIRLPPMAIQLSPMAIQLSTIAAIPTVVGAARTSGRLHFGPVEAVATSVVGTFEPCQAGLTMSVVWGRPEGAGPRSK
jgi:hypothetical protein